MASGKSREQTSPCEEKVRGECGRMDNTNGKTAEQPISKSEINKELNRFSGNLGIITIISALLNLVLIGIVMLVMNNLVNSAVTEQYKQLSTERKAFTAFMEKKSSLADSNLENDVDNKGDRDYSYGNKRRSGNLNKEMPPNEKEVMPLHLLYNAPISSLEKVDSIIFEFEQVDEHNRGIMYQNMYHVESVSREVPIIDEYKIESEAILKFNLSDNNKLILKREEAILSDGSGNEIHKVIFANDTNFEYFNYDYGNEIENEKAGRLLRMEKQVSANDTGDRKEVYENQKRDYHDDSKHKRKLISTNSHKHTASHSLKTQSAYMAAVCKYGCGEMGVTYPYYYRPFFGYGFPLLGTEPYFQSGYGGNVETAMNNNMFNPESSIPRPPGVQGTPTTSPFSMNENPYNYPYSASPGGGYYYYYVYPNPTLTNNQEIYDPNYYYEESYQFQPNLNSTEIH
ncbi:hypothetical protein FG386_000108 [Cryptosporidium ryanae]|uniref:uncharacterized protein n=1 Tax=Cryptosporidium ryanae TaxID=515981 RepID=UPI00351A2BCA|nr:hypothetical protein FG386_000108 [Cryptosporidium ryanae]